MGDYVLDDFLITYEYLDYLNKIVTCILLSFWVAGWQILFRQSRVAVDSWYRSDQTSFKDQIAILFSTLGMEMATVLIWNHSWQAVHQAQNRVLNRTRYSHLTKAGLPP